MSFRCRHGHHRYRRESVKRNLMARDRTTRYTSIEIQKCIRCGHTVELEHFDQHSYWADFAREVEDRRLQDNIRKALR